ncbi:MAG: PEP-utilizing enzyme [Alcanivorax sp.]|nr:PEP-utilizing enzyme [Alcanivorax sp.]
MSIEVLTADARGSENLQRWAAMGLPVPPSWRLSRETVLAISQQALEQRLHALPRMFPAEHYWVLQQGPMNPDSRRESLLNLDSDGALATALRSIFQRDNSPDHLVIQALPKQAAAGVLFTRHPLRQDLAHVVVEGVSEGSSQRQRLIFDEQGRLVHRTEHGKSLDALVGEAPLMALYKQLKQNFDRPQAGEWVFDGEQLWLLQTLPVGSLPVPKEAWTRRAGSGLFNQVVTPLWYTLAGRWLKTRFWQPLTERAGWQGLDKVEPYRRQHSHIYTNCAFFRELQVQHPGASDSLPPAWQPLDEPQPAAPRIQLQRHWQALQLRRVAFALQRWGIRHHSREGLWRALMRLDQLGERLARCEGELTYLSLPDAARSQQGPVPLQSLLSGIELQAIESLLAGDTDSLKQSPLRPGDDPVHAALREGPAQAECLHGVAGRDLQPSASTLSAQLELPLRLEKMSRGLRYGLGNRLREVLRAMGALLVNEGLLNHPDDVYFLYFDELWQLWMAREVPASAGAEKLAQRKIRYLEDGHQGAPDWMMDQIGYGFGGGYRLSPVLRGRPLVAGRVTGPIRRVCSAWGLNRIHPGDIVVVDQVEASWLPWLLQAGALVIAGADPLNGAASLARACGIPAIWGASDVMHSVRDDLLATLDAEQGVLDVDEAEVVDSEPGGD